MFKFFIIYLTYPGLFRMNDVGRGGPGVGRAGQNMRGPPLAPEPRRDSFCSRTEDVLEKKSKNICKQKGGKLGKFLKNERKFDITICAL